MKYKKFSSILYLYKIDVLLALLSAFLMVLLTYRVNFAAYLAIAPLLFVIYKRNFKTAVSLCAFAGFASSLFMFDWVYSYKISLYIFVIILWALFFAAFGALTNFLYNRTKYLALFVAPCVWLWLMFALDFTRYGSYVFEFSMYNPMAAPLIWLIGGRGITFFVIALNSAIAGFAFQQTKKRMLNIAVISAILISCYAYSSIAEAKGEPLKVMLVQGNFDETWEWRQDHVTEIFDSYKRLSDGRGKEALIVWPEYTLPIDIAHYYPSILDRVKAFVKNNKAYLVTGSIIYDAESGDHYDVALLFNPDGNLIDYYKSVNPAFYNEHTLKGDEGIKLFTINGKKAGSMICAEETDSRIARLQTQEGTQFLVSLSNNQNFSRGIYPSGLYSRLRAAENYKYLLRAANTGVTQIINPYGKSYALESDKRKVLIGEILLNKHKTPYTLYGDAPLYIITLLFIAFVRKKGCK